MPEHADGLRRCVIVSPHFPPSTLAGVHRARHMAKHLPAHGWRPIVLSVDEREYSETPDPELAALLPEGLEQVRATALTKALARRIGIGDIGLRGYFGLGSALDATIARERPAAVFITGSPFYPMLLAGRIKRRWGLPVILDFQDPWVSAHGARRPALSKEGLSHRLAVALEPLALRHADYVTSVSDTQNDQMAERYPWLERARMSAIPIGGDPDDFEALRARPPQSNQVLLNPDLINLSYVGAFLPRAEPLVRQLFRALADIRDRSPQLALNLRLNFVGTSNQPDGANAFLVRPIAEEEGVGDLVQETPQRVKFLEALSLLSNSQGLLLIGSDEPHYTASKIYPALMSGKPYLSLFHAASSAHAILSAAGGGISLAFDGAPSLQQLRPMLADGLARLATAPSSLGAADPAVYAAYTANAVAGRFAAIFEKIA